MLALSIIPGRSGSADLTDVPALKPASGAVLARTLAVGVCGTDREILEGGYGVAPVGHERLIIGHECLAQVIAAPVGTFAEDDLIVPFVRRPDPIPCAACSAGEWDMCLNGEYIEHGIKGLHGFCTEEICVDVQACVRLEPHLQTTGVLLEPASVVVKAWDHIERIGARTSSWQPQRVLVTGAGPIGLLAALLARQRGLELHVYDREQHGLKPDLVHQLGGRYHSDSIDSACSIAPDVILECTGAAPVIEGVLSRNAPGAIVCLAGLSSGAHRIPIDLSAFNRRLVLENDVVFGSVNANRRHYELAAAALAQAEENWLKRLITRRVPIRDWQRAFERQPGDVKVVIDFV
jgi:glucose 1-dehydrogenase